MLDIPANSSYIGWWGQRLHQKWHLVESEVTDRLVMHCGRMMQMENSYGPLVFETSPDSDLCEQCAGKQKAI